MPYSQPMLSPPWMKPTGWSLVGVPVPSTGRACA